MKFKAILKYVIIVFLILIFFHSYSQQDTKHQYKMAEKYLEEADYVSALEKYEIILNTMPNNANILFKMGFCYYMLPGQQDTSIEYFEQIGDKVTSNYTSDYSDTLAPVDVLIYLADLYHSNYEFEKAKSVLKKVKQFSNDVELLKNTNIRLQKCDYAIMLFKDKQNISRIELGGNINTEYNEHSPLLTADLKTIIFTSNRKGTGGLKDEYGEYYEDIYISKFINDQWTDAVGISPNINTNKHEASVGLLPDGKTLIIYKGTNNGDIYISEKKNGVWSVPVLAGKNINTAHRETHATMTVDKKTLYFTSSRRGGFEGTDLYVSHKQIDGTWGKAVNMGKDINSPANEEGPFIHPDDTTLFYSSNGFPGMGGFDLFMSLKQKNGTWSKPINLGYPTNSPNDDVFYIASPGGNYAFYVSNQFGSSGTNGIYMLGLPEKFRKKTAVFSGKVKLYDSELETQISINVIDTKTKEVIRTYYPEKNGNYTIILPVNKEYLVSFDAEGYLSHIFNMSVSENADLQSLKKIIYLQAITIGGINENYNIEFEPNTDSITYQTEYKFGKITKKLEEYPELFVMLNIPKNDSLQNKKIASVKNYFIKNRIDTNRIQLNFSKRNYYELLVADTVFLNFYRNIKFVEYKPNLKNIKTISKHHLDQLIFFLQRNQELCVEIPVYDIDELWGQRLLELYSYLASNGADSSQIAFRQYKQPIKHKNKILPKLINKSEASSQVLLSITDKGFKLNMKYRIDVSVILQQNKVLSKQKANKIMQFLSKNKADTTRIILEPKIVKSNYNNNLQKRIEFDRKHSKDFFSLINSEQSINNKEIYLIPFENEGEDDELYTAEIDKTYSEHTISSKKKYYYRESYNNTLQKMITRE